MRSIVFGLVFLYFPAHSQWTTYTLGVKGDTLNKMDLKGQKQGKWVIHYDEVRGEPGHEEEGEFRNNRKEGIWRQYYLTGDLLAIETYRWGNKDGNSQYFNHSGELLREESWRAMNPDKQFDTVEIEDIDHLDHYRTVILKNEGIAIKHGTWKYYDPVTGFVVKTVQYTLGKLETPKSGPIDSTALASRSKSQVKPKEVQEYEKKNAGKKRIRVRDGSVQ